MRRSSSDQTVPEKTRIRAGAKDRRRLIYNEVRDDIGEDILKVFLKAFPVEPDWIVAGYWPIDTETDVIPLLRHLSLEGVTCALPVPKGPEEPMIYRRWEPGAMMENGLHGILQPTESAPEVIPNMVLVPLLAYDDAGHRLGYGSGYYDRALSRLRKKGDVIAVGIAYAGQKVDKLPINQYDQQLDWVVTEIGAERFTEHGEQVAG